MALLIVAVGIIKGRFVGRSFRRLGRKGAVGGIFLLIVIVILGIQSYDSVTSFSQQKSTNIPFSMNVSQFTIEPAKFLESNDSIKLLISFTAVIVTTFLTNRSRAGNLTRKTINYINYVGYAITYVAPFFGFVPSSSIIILYSIYQATIFLAIIFYSGAPRIISRVF